MAKFKIGDCVRLITDKTKTMTVFAYGTDDSFDIQVRDGRIVHEHDPEEDQTVLRCEWKEDGKMTWANYGENELELC
ncbi:MAG: hypothetical protein WBP41_11365 [Saprospiraceae bacterium]